jgi:hypothetical protein
MRLEGLVDFCQEFVADDIVWPGLCQYRPTTSALLGSNLQFPRDVLNRDPDERFGTVRPRLVGGRMWGWPGNAADVKICWRNGLEDDDDVERGKTGGGVD